MSATVWVLEGIVIAVFLIAVSTCYRRGLLSSIISLLGYVIACVGAFIGSKGLAETVYRMFLHERLVQGFQTTIAEYLPGTLVDDYTGFGNFAPEKLMEVIPSTFRGLVSKAMEEVSFLDHMSGNLMDTSESLVETLVYPSVLIVLQAILFFVLFLALLIVVKIAVKFFQSANKIPVIGTANALLGAVVGFFEAVVLLMLLTSFVKVLFAAGLEFSFLTQADIDNTTLFAAFYYRSFGELFSRLTV